MRSALPFPHTYGGRKELRDTASPLDTRDMDLMQCMHAAHGMPHHGLFMFQFRLKRYLRPREDESARRRGGPEKI